MVWLPFLCNDDVHAAHFHHGFYFGIFIAINNRLHGANDMYRRCVAGINLCPGISIHLFANTGHYGGFDKIRTRN